MDEGWENYRIFGSLYNSRIKDQNKEMVVGKYDECISIFNARCHPFLEAGIFTLGQLLKPDTGMKEYSSIIFKLEVANLPGEQIKKQLETILNEIIKKVHK